jgi:hypothetical protein
MQFFELEEAAPRCMHPTYEQVRQAHGLVNGLSHDWHAGDVVCHELSE